MNKVNLKLIILVVKLNFWFSIKHLSIRLISPFFRPDAVNSLLKFLPYFFRILPVNMRGYNYIKAKQNLSLIIPDEELVEKEALLYSANEVKKLIQSHLYEVRDKNNISDLFRRINKIPLIDENDFWACSKKTKTIIMPCHCGEYWYTIAKIVFKHEKNTEFFIPIVAEKNEQTYKAISFLEKAGYKINIAVLSDKDIGLQWVKAIKKNMQIIVFGDLPGSLSGVNFGANYNCFFLNKKAIMAKTPLAIASKFGYSILLIGHEINLSGLGEVIVHDFIKHESFDIMSKSLTLNLSKIIEKNPSNWFYLCSLDRFYQQQNGLDNKFKSL